MAGTTTARHDVVIIGGGSAGITVAARLHRAGVRGLAVIEPSTMHCYQPLWTIVGGGLADVRRFDRPRHPHRGPHRWTSPGVPGPDRGAGDSAELGGHRRTAAEPGPGRRLQQLRLPLRSRDLGLHPQHHPRHRGLRSAERGDQVRRRTPEDRIPGVDYWRRQGVLQDIDVHLVLPTPGMFGVPEFARILEQVVDRYGITVHFSSEVVEVDPEAREAVVRDLVDDTKSRLPTT